MGGQGPSEACRETRGAVDHDAGGERQRQGDNRRNLARQHLRAQDEEEQAGICGR